MKSKLYQLSQENFETILAYYKLTKEKSQKYYDYFIKYKEYTNNYCTNIKQLFNNDENISNINNDINDYENITIDYRFNPNNNSNNIINLSNTNVNNLKAIKKINISPIQHNINKINKFFNLNIQSLQLFVDTIHTSLEQLKQNIDESQIEINNIKNNYFREKQTFFQKFSEFDELNKKLRMEYVEGERQLIEYSLKKKSLKNEKEKEENFLNDINLKIIDKVKNEKNILKKYKSFNNFGKNFNDSTKQKINEIKSKTSILFQKFEMCLNNILNFYKKSFLIPINQIINQEKEINDKNEFDNLLKNNIKEINEQIYNINFDEYKIKILDDNEVSKDEVYEERKIINDTLKDFSFELTEEQKEMLEEDDIYFIMKKMKNFKHVNKYKYDLNIEEEKLNLKHRIDKLTTYANKRKKTYDFSANNSKILEEMDRDKNIKSNNIININKINSIKNKKQNENNINNVNENNINNNLENKIEKNNIENNINDLIEPATQEDVNYICKEMNIKEYRLYFLSKINNFRAKGAFNIPLKTFNFLVQIFKEISKYLIVDNNKEDDKEINIDMDTAKLMIILSQTFYCMKGDKKVYIQNDLNTEKVFHSIEFWSKIIKINIEKEILNCMKNDKFIGKKDNEEDIIKRRNTIAFAQIIPQLSGMKGFGLNIEEMKKVVIPLLDEFNVSQENKEIILNTIDSPNLI